tara:strand:- start:116 stop:937 length:822 start_codon:yes stop_codon:yes gene_type:complete
MDCTNKILTKARAKADRQLRWQTQAPNANIEDDNDDDYDDNNNSNKHADIDIIILPQPSNEEEIVETTVAKNIVQSSLKQATSTVENNYKLRNQHNTLYAQLAGKSIDIFAKDDLFVQDTTELVIPPSTNMSSSQFQQLLTSLKTTSVMFNTIRFQPSPWCSDQFITVLQALERQCEVNKLCVSGLQLNGSDVAKSLCIFLELHKSILEELDLSWNYFNPVSMTSILNQVSMCEKMNMLDLSFNPECGDEQDITRLAAIVLVNASSILRVESL